MKKAVAVALVVSLLMSLWGAYVAYAVISMNPKLEASWGNVSEGEVEIVVDAGLGKPLLVPASVENLSIKFNEVEVASLEEFKYSPTKPDAELVIELDTNKLVKAIESYFNNGQRGKADVRVKLGLFGLLHPTLKFSQEFHKDVLGQMNFKAESKPILGGLLHTPSVEGTRVVWMGGEDGVWKLKAYVTLKNPNSIPIPVSNLEFEISANGITVGKGKTSQGVTIPAGGIAKVPIDVEIYSEYLPKVLATHIKNGEESTVRLNIYITAGIAGKSVRIGLKSEEVVVKTDVMTSINEALSNVSRRE
ncbi:MAG: hypothetical protein PWQ95_1964 [Thermococcaceae archaeon]|nr:hypothetical protein [Thermococcaceae archaeon]